MKNTDTPSIERLRELLAELAGAEASYRGVHDRRGDGDMLTGRAWDRLRRAGDKARAALTASPPLEQPDIEGRARELQAYHDGLCTAARMVRRFMGDQYGENSALIIDVDEGTQADKPTLAYVADALERRALSSASRREAFHGPFNFPYQATFNAIASAVDQRNATGLGISVAKFEASFNASGAAIRVLACPPSRPSFDKWDYARAVLKDSEGCGR